LCVVGYVRVEAIKVGGIEEVEDGVFVVTEEGSDFKRTRELSDFPAYATDVVKTSFIASL
jgi:hypothetical protein